MTAEHRCHLLHEMLRIRRFEERCIELYSAAGPDVVGALQDLMPGFANIRRLGSQAQTAMAESLAAQAGIKPERVEMFVRLVDLSGALNGVDPTDLTAVRGAIKAAVDQTAASLPEFKAGAGLPAASGGDRQGQGQPSLDERIAAAQKSGDHATAIALKRQKLYQTGG